MSKAFASTSDFAEKTVSFTEIGPGLWAYTGQGDPNTGVIIGDGSVLVWTCRRRLSWRAMSSP
jgi:hypothetical protein